MNTHEVDQLLQRVKKVEWGKLYSMARGDMKIKHDIDTLEKLSRMVIQADHDLQHGDEHDIRRN